MEAVSVIAVCFALITMTTLVLILQYFCYDYQTWWIIVIIFVYINYFNKKLKRQPDITNRIISGKASSLEYNKYGAIAFAIFTWSYAIFATFIWEYLHNNCI
jgi:hypothetical protein